MQDERWLAWVAADGDVDFSRSLEERLYVPIAEEWLRYVSLPYSGQEERCLPW